MDGPWFPEFPRWPANAGTANTPISVATATGRLKLCMAARPLRIRNFQDIELFRTLVHRSGTYWLVFGEDETKTGRQVDLVKLVAGFINPLIR